MGQRRREVQVGICVIVSALMLVFGLLWFKQFRFGGRTNDYQAVFPAVDGLQVRDRVQVRGIRMGKVTGMRVVEDHVRVAFELDRAVALHANAAIRLQTIGIVGEKVMEIQPGSGSPVAPGHVFQGELEASLTSMGSTINRSLEKMEALGDEVSALMRDLRRDDLLAGAIGAARGAFEEFDGALAENRRDLRGLVRELHAAASSLRAAVADTGGGAAGALSTARHTLARTDSTLIRVEQAAAGLQRLIDRLEAGEGSAGKLLADEQLHDETARTLAEVRELIKDMRRNPKKFFRFSVVDF